MLTQIEVIDTASLFLKATPLEQAEIRIRKAVGLEPVPASVLTEPYSSQEGEALMGASQGKRNIVLTLGLHPNWSQRTYDDLLNILYRRFIPRRLVRLRLYKVGRENTRIDAVVESISTNRWAKDPEVTVSLVCPSPFFTGEALQFIDGVAPNVTQPIDYQGTAPVGFQLDIYATGSGNSSDGAFGFYNQTQDNYFPFNAGGKVYPGNKIRMITTPGSRSLRQVPDSGSSSSLLSTIQLGSKWPLLDPGLNQLTLLTSGLTAQIKWYLAFYNRYGES